METKKIEFSDFSSRGKWKSSELKAFLKEQHKPKTAIAVPLMDFYKQFYAGSNVIKYAGYYSRAHVLDACKELKFKAICSVDGEELKIGFID